MTVIFIAILHALPVVLAPTLFESRNAPHIAAAIMALVAIIAGDPAYNLVDLLAVGVGYMIALNLRQRA